MSKCGIAQQQTLLNMTFKDKVYKFTQKIPKGKVATYKSVAIAIGQPQASRVVANVLAQNFDPKIFCHRVVKSDGGVGGYNRGVKTKIELLKKEKVEVRNDRVDMKKFACFINRE